MRGGRTVSLFGRIPGSPGYDGDRMPAIFGPSSVLWGHRVGALSYRMSATSPLGRSYLLISPTCPIQACDRRTYGSSTRTPAPMNRRVRLTVRSGLALPLAPGLPRLGCQHRARIIEASNRHDSSVDNVNVLGEGNRTEHRVDV